MVVAAGERLQHSDPSIQPQKKKKKSGFLPLWKLKTEETMTKKTMTKRADSQTPSGGQQQPMEDSLRSLEAEEKRRRQL